MAVTLLEKIPTLEGQKARDFIDKANNPKEIKITKEEIAMYKAFSKIPGSTEGANIGFPLENQ